MPANWREVEERRRDYVRNDMLENAAWRGLVFDVENDGHPALVLLDLLDHGNVLVTFERITDGRAEKMMDKARASS